MNKLVKYVCTDILRNRIVIGYTFFLLLISLSLFSLEDNASKGLLSLLNLVLIIVPLVSVIFSTIYIYNSAEFIELLVSQPLRRKHLWSSLFIGLAGSLSLAFLIGVGLPLIILMLQPQLEWQVWNCADYYFCSYSHAGAVATAIKQRG